MNNIQNARKKCKFSQTEIANELNVDRSTVAKWETGKALPRAEMLIKLANVLECTVDELLTGENKTAHCK